MISIDRIDTTHSSGNFENYNESNASLKGYAIYSAQHIMGQLRVAKYSTCRVEGGSTFYSLNVFFILILLTLHQLDIEVPPFDHSWLDIYKIVNSLFKSTVSIWRNKYRM